MNRREYRVLVRGFDKNDNYIWADKGSRSSEERFNAMGLEGWELIEVLTVSRPTISSWAGQTTGLHYIFKRSGQ